MKGMRTFFNIVGMVLVVAAVRRELKKPSDERTWQGEITFSVPYDFTIPSVQRLRESYWNTQDDRILTDRVFGVGWAINMHALLRRLGWLATASGSGDEQ